ncbi:MAG: M23 family metallopeptidase, partial [Anaerolineae bacterium]
SHGTDVLGETYAYDFVRLGPGSRGRRFYRPSLLHYLVFGVQLQDCFGWGQPIFASTAGLVVQAEDGWPERNPVHPVRDLAILLRCAWTFDERTTNLRLLSGNYIIVESSEGYAVYAHAQTGSIKVAPGGRVVPGQRLANVGHSGNSSAPHLHFHLMDHQDPRQAQGIPCSFRDYEVLREGAWHPVQNGIPKDTDRIRKL